MRSTRIVEIAVTNSEAAECAQSRIVKGCGTGDVGDTDPRMIDHDDNPQTCRSLSREWIRLHLSINARAQSQTKRSYFGYLERPQIFLAAAAAAAVAAAAVGVPIYWTGEEGGIVKTTTCAFDRCSQFVD
jgi:hypothetical protein